MKKYSICLSSGIFTVLLIVTVFNWLINPYDIFTSPDIAGLNQYKSEVERHTRLSKVYQVEKIKPDVILLASSRGLIVPEAFFSKDNMTAFNLSLASASTYELLRMFQHAQAVSPLERVVLALDEKFTESVQPNFKENRMAVNPDGSENRGKWLQKWRDLFSSLFSIDALRSSLRTIRKQKENPGMIDVHQYNAERVFNAGGHRQMFRAMEASIFSGYNGPIHVCQKPLAEIKDVEIESAIYFEKIIELAYENNIDLYIYISPVHARLYEANCMVGKSPITENMKRAVVKIVENKANKYSSDPYPVWDFSGYNSITTEKVTGKGDKVSVMKWYWEGSHYTHETAEIIFNKILSDTDVYDDFGVKLTFDNIDKHLNDIWQQRKIYLETYADDVEELHSIFEDATR